MKIITDTREQAPYLFEEYGVETIRETLEIGDYSLPGFTDVIAVERKSLPDFVGSITSGRERFEREMRRGMLLRYFLVVVEGSWEQVCKGHFDSMLKPKSAINTVLSWEQRFGVHFRFCTTRAGAEYVTFNTLRLFHDRIASEAKALHRWQQ